MTEERIKLRILYQNQETGEAYDITDLCMSPRWSTYRRGAAGSLELEVLSSSEIPWNLGGYLMLRTKEAENGKGYFYGIVTKISKTHKDTIAITAQDQLFYLLKNKDTYAGDKVAGKKANEIAAIIAADFKLRIGTLADTGYVIPDTTEDGQTLLDIILRALDKTIINTKNMFFLWDNYGELCISNVMDRQVYVLLGDKSIVTGYNYSADISSDTYNRIKLVIDDKERGQRVAYMAPKVDDKVSTLSVSQGKWGLLQYWENVDENMTPAQIKERAENLLLIKNRPTETFSLKGIIFDNYDIRGGSLVTVKIDKLGLSKQLLVEQCTYDLHKNEISLRLKVM